MQFHWSFMLSDVLFWALIIICLLYVAYVIRHPHLMTPWKKVGQRSIAMMAMVVFGFYLIVCLLDCVHITLITPQSTQVTVSLLDQVLPAHMEQAEKTYSSPLSQTLYSQSMLMAADGQPYRGYAPLSSDAAQSMSASQWHASLWHRFFLGGLWGAIIALICHGLYVVVSVACHRNCQGVINLWRGNERIAWRSAWITLLVGCVFLGSLWSLSLQAHVLGTTQVGIDVWYETLKSIRTGMIIGLLTTVFMLPFALVMGSLAGYFSGWCDDLIQYIYITLSSIPGVLLISAVILVMQVYIHQHEAMFPTVASRADMRLVALCLVLGLTSWATLCRLLRAETLKLKHMDYVMAAKTQGVSAWRIIVRHILPNVMHIIIITLVLDFSGLVLAEAVLSYVGVGVDPSTFSWGNMINSARLELAREPMVWWPLVSAIMMMFGLVLSVNLLADAVRDAFDPRVS